MGDILAQYVQWFPREVEHPPLPGKKKIFQLDYTRTASFVLFGGLYTGAFQYHWFGLLRSFFPPGRRFAVLGPTLINQFGMVRS